MANRLHTLGDELENDPLGRVYSGMSNEQIVDSLNTQDRSLPGDEVSAAKRALTDAVVGSFLVLAVLDRYLFTEASSFADKRNRKVYAVVLDRQRIADSLSRQLSLLGLERKARPAIDLKTYISAPPGQETPKETKGADS